MISDDVVVELLGTAAHREPEVAVRVGVAVADDLDLADGDGHVLCEGAELTGRLVAPRLRAFRRLGDEPVAGAARERRGAGGRVAPERATGGRALHGEPC